MENQTVVYAVDSSELDDLCFRLQCGIEQVLMLREALEQGNYQPCDYTCAAFGVYDHLRQILDELKALVESSFKEVKAAA